MFIGLQVMLDSIFKTQYLGTLLSMMLDHLKLPAEAAAHTHTQTRTAA